MRVSTRPGPADAIGWRRASALDAELAQSLRALLETQRIASLGTLHNGEPYVSMVPFALRHGPTDFVIHVSRLAAHTKDMVASPLVSLMIVAPPSPEIAPQAMARVTIQGDAVQALESAPGHTEMKQAYLARFPQSAMTFELSDFSLFAIKPRSIRFVGGFAQARSISPATLAGILGHA